MMKLTVEEYRNMTKKPPKYRNVKTQRTMPNGSVHTFDSQKEAARYDELTLMLKAGKIYFLRLQPTFTLQESYIAPEGTRIKAIKYIADFSYREGKGYLVVEDVKSKPTRTAEYRMKKKMMQEKYGISVREI